MSHGSLTWVDQTKSTRHWTDRMYNRKVRNSFLAPSWNIRTLDPGCLFRLSLSARPTRSRRKNRKNPQEDPLEMTVAELKTHEGVRFKRGLCVFTRPSLWSSGPSTYTHVALRTPPRQIVDACRSGPYKYIFKECIRVGSEGDSQSLWQ